MKQNINNIDTIQEKPTIEEQSNKHIDFERHSLGSDMRHSRVSQRFSLDAQEENQTCLESLPSILFFLFIFGLISFAAYDYEKVLEIFYMFIEWVKVNPLSSSMAIVGIYSLLVVFTLPILYLSIALGFAFSKAFPSAIEGYFFGLFFITIGITLGGILAFLLSRYFFSKMIKRTCLKNHHSFIAIDSVISEEGWKTVLLLRMTPLPYAVSSYLLGITQIHIKQYIIGSLGVIMHVLIWLYIGQSLDRFTAIKKKQDTNEAGTLEYIFLSLEVIAAFTVGIVVSIKAKRVLDRKLDAHQNDELIELASINQQ